MLKKITLLTLVVFSLGTTAFNQSAPWTLEQCVKYAQQNSLTVKRALNGIDFAAVNDVGNRMQRLPSFNANASYTLSFGRNVNQATNEFTTENNGNGGASIGGRFACCNGLYRLRHD